MLDRNEALQLIKKHSKKRYMFFHMLEVEAIMKALALHFNENEEKWSLTGLLHDIDFEETEENPKDHGLKAEEILKGLAPQEIIHAIKAHNFDYTRAVPASPMDNGLIAADAIAGLLVACALVMPSKKLREVKVETVAKKLKDKDFARSIDRNRVLYYEKMGVGKEEFIKIALEGLKKIDAEIGL